MLRHWVQASWNHWRQLRHCSIFRFHLKGKTAPWASGSRNHRAPSPSSFPSVLGSTTTEHPCHGWPCSPSLHLLPRAPAVTVALLPVAQMSGVPVQPFQTVWQGEFHAQHGPGIGTLLQGTSPLQRKREASEGREGGEVTGGSHTSGREVPLPSWQSQRHTGGRPRRCPLLLQGLGPWGHDSPGDRLNKERRPWCVCI